MRGVDALDGTVRETSAVCLLLPPAGEFPTLAPLEGGFVDGRIAHRSNQRSLKSH